MKTISIEVNVKGGTEPSSIIVFIDKVNSNHDILIKRKQSFTETYRVELGEYNVIISGDNRPETQTTIKVTSVDSLGMINSKAYTLKNELFSKIFKVNI